jgi:hypothetical protein
MADIGDLMRPGKHARIDLDLAGGGNLLYLVSTEVIRLTGNEFAGLSPKTLETVSNLRPKPRDLDASRMPWWGYIRAPQNDGDAGKTIMDDKARTIL